MSLEQSFMIAPSYLEIASAGVNVSGQYMVIDCDNFFVACEQVFMPWLKGRPTVVLSCNDGCVVSRSPEIKALGVPMGGPWFQIADEMAVHNVQKFSSNFHLYGDMSRRMISILRRFCPNVEVYSVDEVFLYWATLAPSVLTERARQMRAMVGQWTGLPVSIGIGATKTLAKTAVHYAKRNKQLTGGVWNWTECSQSEQDTILRNTPVEEVWGIGHQLKKWLRLRGIGHALDLRGLNDEFMRKKAGITGLSIIWELRGVAYRSLDLVYKPRQTITCSRSFGKKISTTQEMRTAVSVHASRAALELRNDRQVAGRLTVFMISIHPEEVTLSRTVALTPPSDSTIDLIRAALRGLEEIYEDGHRFGKAGVTLTDLSPADQQATDLFVRPDYDKRERLDETLDYLNESFGVDTVRYAATTNGTSWRPRSLHRSPRYTTHWDELPVVRVK